MQITEGTYEHQDSYFMRRLRQEAGLAAIYPYNVSAKGSTNEKHFSYLKKLLDVLNPVAKLPRHSQSFKALFDIKLKNLMR